MLKFLALVDDALHMNEAAKKLVAQAKTPEEAIMIIKMLFRQQDAKKGAK